MLSLTNVVAMLFVAFTTPAWSTWTKSDLAKRSDCLDAMTLHAGGNDAEALTLFPDKEPGGYLTTLDKGWLATLDAPSDGTSVLVDYVPGTKQEI